MFKYEHKLRFNNFGIGVGIMTKYMFLYYGPDAGDIGLSQPPLSQASLSQWAQQASTYLVDRGTVFGVDSVRVRDDGIVSRGAVPLHGYSIVQASTPEEVLTLAWQHPFLAANVNKGAFEIHIIEIADTDRPLAGPLDEESSALMVAVRRQPQSAPPVQPMPPAQTAQATPAAASATLPPPETTIQPQPGASIAPQAPAPGELTIPHEEPKAQPPTQPDAT